MVGWMTGIVAGLTLLVVCSMGLGTELLEKFKTIDKRIYPDGNTQSLITTCQADEKISRAANSRMSNGGYFWGESSDAFVGYSGLVSEKRKIYCDVVEKVDDKIKVKYGVSYYGTIGDIKQSKWLDKKDFFKYYTLQELSEMAHKKNKKGRK